MSDYHFTFVNHKGIASLRVTTDEGAQYNIPLSVIWSALDRFGTCNGIPAPLFSGNWRAAWRGIITEMERQGEE